MAGQNNPSKPRRLPRRVLSDVNRASGLYPFKGIYYFVAHPFLWPLLKGRLLPCAVLSFFVLSTLFIWTYLPQVAFLSIFNGFHLALINGAFLVLGEGCAIVALVFEGMFVDETLVDVFDAVLINEGHEELISTSRTIHSEEHTPVRRLGKPIVSAVYSPFSFRQIAEFIIFLPLNFIPIVGVPIFLLLTGYRAGPLHHWRYFKLLDFTKKDRNLYIKRRQLKYTWFGTSALLLQLVPVLSMLFLLTTAAGSALWVAKLEDVRAASNEDGQNGEIDEETPPRGP